MTNILLLIRLNINWASRVNVLYSVLTCASWVKSNCKFGHIKLLSAVGWWRNVTSSAIRAAVAYLWEAVAQVLMGGFLFCLMQIVDESLKIRIIKAMKWIFGFIWKNDYPVPLMEHRKKLFSYGWWEAVLEVLRNKATIWPVHELITTLLEASYSYWQSKDLLKLFMLPSNRQMSLANGWDTMLETIWAYLLIHGILFFVHLFPIVVKIDVYCFVLSVSWTWV